MGGVVLSILEVHQLKYMQSKITRSGEDRVEKKRSFFILTWKPHPIVQNKFHGPILPQGKLGSRGAEWSSVSTVAPTIGIGLHVPGETQIL